ncbi:MAG: hypothetical protein ACI8S6_005103 [Myxococcota bacterium]|jgi:hypothetical protein
MQRLVLALAISALAAGCALMCEEAGCQGTYVLTFEADSWADGEYELYVALDGVEAAGCAIVLPLEDGATCGGGYAEVTMVDGALTVPVPTPMNEDLVEAEIKLSLDGDVLVSETVEPAWGDPFWPNSKACDRGYGCLSAEDTITL